MELKDIFKRVDMAKIGAKVYLHNIVGPNIHNDEINESLKNTIDASLDYYCALIHQELEEAYKVSKSLQNNGIVNI